MFFKTGLVWKQMSISRCLLGITFGVPSKIVLPTGSPLRAPTLEGALFPESFFIHLSKFPVYGPPSKFPIEPLWRGMPIFRAILYISFRVLTKGDLQVPLTGPL